MCVGGGGELQQTLADFYVRWGYVARVSVSRTCVTRTS